MAVEVRNRGLVYYSCSVYKEKVLGWPTYIVKIRIEDGRELELGKIYYVGGVYVPPQDREEGNKGMWRAYRCSEDFDSMREAGEHCFRQFIGKRGYKKRKKKGC